MKSGCVLTGRILFFCLACQRYAHQVYRIKQRLYRLFRYLITFILLAPFALGTLFACGLVPQEQEEKNDLLTMEELRPEWQNFNFIRLSMSR